jgi:methylated-DNA-[protein]-cysteine S-methyltransferase
MKRPESIYFSTFETPAGLFSVAVDFSGAVIAAAFGDERALMRRVSGEHAVPDSEKTARARTEIMNYFRSPRIGFSLNLAPRGTDFQKRVWAALRNIPSGQTRSYGDIARELRSSPRAVGQANGANPICLIVPCHRVVASDGSLGGFAFGVATKRMLLEHEGATACYPSARWIASTNAFSFE